MSQGRNTLGRHGSNDDDDDEEEETDDDDDEDDDEGWEHESDATEEEEASEEKRLAFASLSGAIEEVRGRDQHSLNPPPCDPTLTLRVKSQTYERHSL